MKAIKYAPGLVAGQNFLFVVGAEGLRSTRTAEAMARHGGHRSLPLWGQTYRLESQEIVGPNLDRLSLMAVSTDKEVYREGDDTVSILLVDPARPDEDVRLEIECAGASFRSTTVQLDWNGMAVYTMGDLVAGRYVVKAGMTSTSFEVAGYQLAPMESKISRTLLEGVTLNCTLELTSFSRPVSGRVRVVLLEKGRPVYGPIELDSIEGVLATSFPLQGDGPYVAHVTGVDDPGLDAQIPLRGTGRQERDRTWISRLGAEFAASLLPASGARECRGLWINREGTNNAPVRLEEPIGQVGRFKAMTTIEHLVLTVLHPGEHRIQHRPLGTVDAGSTIELGAQPPFSVAMLGGFVAGEPWEGMAALVPPTNLGLDVQAESRVGPRTELQVTLRTRRPGGEASVYLVVRDSRLRPMDHPRTQLGGLLKRSIEDHQRPRSPQYAPDSLRVGEALFANGLISKEQLSEANARHRQTGRRLERILLEMQVVTERDIAEILSKQLNIPFIDLSNYMIDPTYSRMIPEHIAQRHQLVPLNKVGSKLNVAMADPLDMLAIDEIQLMTQLQVKAVVATPSEVARALQYIYERAYTMIEIDDQIGQTDGIDAGAAVKAGELEGLGDSMSENDVPIIRLCNLIITQAVTSGSSGIHLEPYENELRVRYRRDGVLHTVMTPPKKAQAAVARRLKFMANLNTDDTTTPQIGMTRLIVNRREFAMRVATAMSRWGETIRLELTPGDRDSGAGTGSDGDRDLPAAATGPTRECFPQVVFAGLVHVNGEARIEIPLGDTLGVLEIDAFALHQGDWESVQRIVEVARSTYGELTLPGHVHQDDTVCGRLDLGWQSAPIQVTFTRDGRPVALTAGGVPFQPDTITTPGRATLQFPAGPGRYECEVRELQSGASDTCVREVTPPGRFRGLARRLRILTPGESLSAEQAGALFLRVLPGVVLPLEEMCRVTAGYEHLCCEQTSAKILAAFGSYFAAREPQDRDRARDIIVAGVDRERSMWVKGRGMKLYPGDSDVHMSWGQVTVERLMALSLFHEGRRLPAELELEIHGIEELVEDLVEPCRIERRPTTIHTMSQALRAAVHASVPAAGVEEAIEGRLSMVRGVPSSWEAHGEVVGRVEACHAVAALLRIGTPSSIRRALPIVDWVGRQRGANGAYYSTHDSAAAILMLHELSRRSILASEDGSGAVRLDGHRMSTSQAVARGSDFECVEALDQPVAVEATTMEESDWTQFASNVPLRVTLQTARADDLVTAGDRLELSIELEKYEAGYLAHICLPPALVRLRGGAQIQSFSADFEGRHSLSIPLVAVGTPTPGGCESQHYFVCVRNMFEAERIGNPGELTMTLAART